jgi:hypothetical protein
MGSEVPSARPDHSPPPSAKVKNDWSCISTPQYALMARTETTSFYIFEMRHPRCVSNHSVENEYEKQS